MGLEPLTPEELEITVRRLKKAVIERALGGESHASSRVTDTQRERWANMPGRTISLKA